MLGISFGTFQSMLNDNLSMYQIAAKLVQSALYVLEFLTKKHPLHSLDLAVCDFPFWHNSAWP